MLLFVAAGTTKEHLGFALALKVPIFVVVTKIDMCRKFIIEKTISQLEKILKSPGCKKIPVRIESEDDAVTAAQNFDTHRYGLNNDQVKLKIQMNAAQVGDTSSNTNS